jgi:23S rRNA (adenine2503-C2)-methyltransferase
MTKVNLMALSEAEIFQFIKDQGLPQYRAKQLMHWMYEHSTPDIDEISEFSKELQNIIKNAAFIPTLRLLSRLTSSDGTEKFLFSLEDSENIESVLIPDEGRLTLCISSQVGCGMGCTFCRTAKSGLIRSLKSYEIMAQIISVNRLISPKKITNIVLMGMGEPLANFDEVVKALWGIIQFLGISKRRITVSTAGIVPKMLLLPQKAPDINLAVSLNAPSDEIREKIMPITKRYPIKSLIDVCRKYPIRPGRRITFEYVLLKGVNDSPDDAIRLAKLLKGISGKVNLIPFNPFQGSGLEKPSDQQVLEFQKILLQRNMRALIRKSKGQDILAACGQLRGRHQEEVSRQ